MRIIDKVVALLFLLVLLLASCNSRVSPPAISPTDVMETPIASAQTEISETLTSVPTDTPTFLPPISPIPPTPTSYFPTPLDRHDPEAVLRAYFDAWNRQDWVAKNSLEYQEIAPEPVEFVRILEIKKISSSPTKCVYEVHFEIQVKGSGASMHSGQYVWNYYLTWDPSRDTWCISNYGYG